MINRSATPELIQLAQQFKAVAVIGPRQSGKTTLVRDTFKEKPYVSLENPDTRTFALEDPRGFLRTYSDGAILDEVQRTPELFSYLQEILDESTTPGKFILTGSNNFKLQDSISQSLAGRIAFLELLPFSMKELNYLEKINLNDVLLKGFYPPLFDQNLAPSTWYANYIRTYIERDVRQLRNISNLISFEQFLKLCAGRIGQLLNMNSLAVELGVDQKTITAWISLLESSFILFRLAPHHKNFNKRVVKMPKLYFIDTGVACTLLGIQTIQHLETHPLRGNIFENFCVSELMKTKSNFQLTENLFFWRDNTGHEIDLLIDDQSQLTPIEIKSGQTIHDNFFEGLRKWRKIGGNPKGFLIYGGDNTQERSDGTTVLSWRKIDGAIGTTSL